MKVSGVNQSIKRRRQHYLRNPLPLVYFWVVKKNKLFRLHFDILKLGRTLCTPYLLGSTYHDARKTTLDSDMTHFQVLSALSGLVSGYQYILQMENELKYEKFLYIFNN